jgi:hypothetical protein
LRSGARARPFLGGSWPQRSTRVSRRRRGGPPLRAGGFAIAIAALEVGALVLLDRRLRAVTAAGPLPA